MPHDPVDRPVDRPLDPGARAPAWLLLPALALVPLAVFLFGDDVTDHQPVLAVLTCLVIGAICAATAYLFRGSRPGRLLPAALSSNRPALVVVTALGLLYGVVLSVFHIQHHQNLGTATWDLGIYVNTLWNTSQGDIFACTLLSSGTDITAHFEPILLLLAPLMWFDSGVELLLAAQSVWIGLGVIPLYLITNDRLNQPLAGVVLGIAYLLHPAIHGFNMFDFHSLSLIAPIVFWCLLFLERGRTGWYFVALLMLISAREDMPLVAVFIGLYALARGQRLRIGLATLCLGIAYFAVVKTLIMTDAQSYSSYFADMELEGHSIVASILINTVTRPLWMMGHLLSEPKIVLLLQLTVPLMLIPLFSGRRWILYIYGGAILLLASKPAVFSIHFQYTNLLLPFLFASMPAAIASVRTGRLTRALRLDGSAVTGALLVGVLASSLAMSARYGVFVPNDAFKGGNRSFNRTPGKAAQARYASVEKAKALVPDDAAVVVSSRLGPHFSMRSQVSQFRKRQKRDEKPDYVVVFERDARKDYAKKKLKVLRKSKSFSLIFDEKNVLVFERTQ
jgi:uncharacterized membrane protein